jgi:soluble lytic murein transglycosylase-like protein
MQGAGAAKRNRTASADLRATRRAIYLTITLSTLGLAGCTASGLDLGAQLEAVPNFEAAELPDTAPAPTARASEPPVATVAAAVSPEPSAEEPAIVASIATAFAGPTPTTAASLGSRVTEVKAGSPELDRLITRYSVHYEVPETLVRRVVKRESNFNPRARNKVYWGLMQIHPQTAKSMGYRGSPEGLLDAETNLRYAVKYLRGAYLVADGNHDQAVRFYSRGYYYDAKRKGLLDETGLGRDRRR